MAVKHHYKQSRRIYTRPILKALKLEETKEKKKYVRIERGAGEKLGRSSR